MCDVFFFFLMIRRPPRSTRTDTLFPYTTLFRSRLFVGGWSSSLIREVFERNPVAGVLPYDPVQDAVVLLEQFRTGPMAAKDDNPWLIEIVAGIIEDGETPEDMARREATEEAGCTITDIEPIASFYPSPGGSSEYVHIFCGRTDRTGIGGMHGNKIEDEDIRVLADTLEAAYERMRP